MVVVVVVLVVVVAVVVVLWSNVQTVTVIVPLMTDLRKLCISY